MKESDYKVSYIASVDQIIDELWISSRDMTVGLRGDLREFAVAIKEFIDNEPKILPERFVVCAALRDGYGDIVVGPRHHDRTMRNNIPQVSAGAFRKAEQGFIDQFGVFMTREEAYVVASRNGQIVRRCGGDEGKLFSENLY